MSGLMIIKGRMIKGDESLDSCQESPLLERGVRGYGVREEGSSDLATPAKFLRLGLTQTP